MPPVKVDPDKVRTFEDAESFYAWLGKHHDREGELWIRIFKINSGMKSITGNLKAGMKQILRPDVAS